MYTLYFPNDGTRFTLSLNSRISSTPLLEAASISIMSVFCLLIICVQLTHLLHGFISFSDSQFTIFARILATLVFPVPLGPVNRYA